MATLTIKQIPDDLYRRLKDQARRERRSINSEAIRCLEQALAAPAIDVEDHLARLRALRESIGNVYLTDDELRRVREEGRP